MQDFSPLTTPDDLDHVSREISGSSWRGGRGRPIKSTWEERRERKSKKLNLKEDKRRPWIHVLLARSRLMQGLLHIFLLPTTTIRTSIQGVQKKAPPSLSKHSNLTHKAKKRREEEQQRPRVSFFAKAPLLHHIPSCAAFKKCCNLRMTAKKLVSPSPIRRSFFFQMYSTTKAENDPLFYFEMCFLIPLFLSLLFLAHVWREPCN